MEQETKGTGITFHLFAVNLMEKLVNFFKGMMTESFLEFCSKWLTILGHIGIIVAACLGFLFSLILAIKVNRFNIFPLGIAWFVLIFVVQYTAHKFLSTGDKLIKDNPSRLSSKNFLDCFGFLMLVGGVAVFIMSLVELIQGTPFSAFLQGMGTFVLLEFIALIAFNNGTVSVEIVENNSAGQEAIGIITFFIKTFMRLVPILFGALIILGTISLAIEGVRLFGSSASFAFRKIQLRIAPEILYAALLPFISYLIFAVSHLLIDVIRAILSIPENK